MKELLRHIERYGPRWTIMFRVGENNIIAMVLQFFENNKLYHEEMLMSAKMIDSMRVGDPVLLDTLDRLRVVILKKRK